MWSSKEAYYVASGLAQAKGLEAFDIVMSQERVSKLLAQCNRVHGFQWVEKKFIQYLLHVAWREGLTVQCGKNCKYRMKYDSLPLQRNALRVEIFTPVDRCGAKLKFDRIGGRPDDYLPCTYQSD